MKITCSKCGDFLELERLGLKRYCLPCSNEWARMNRPKHSELNPIQKKKATARSYANVYLKKGKLERKPCEVCSYEVTQFHHDDYDKPLQVRNLCVKCHIGL